jgi:hypothetical protein
MSHVLWPLLSLALLPADEEKSTTLHYVKPAGENYVLDSAITTTPIREGSILVSRTARGGETMTLTIHYDKSGQVTKAEAVQEINRVKKSAVLTFADRRPAMLKRGGITDYLKTSPDVILATEPSWSEVFQLVHRYDPKKAGKQEFPGFWFHPAQPYRTLTFTIERVGADKITVNTKSLLVERYQIHWHDGDYLVWADATGKVCKIQPKKKGAAPVVLEGIEEATQSLK